MKEHRKGYNAGVAVEQQKNTEEQHLYYIIEATFLMNLKRS